MWLKNYSSILFLIILILNVVTFTEAKPGRKKLRGPPPPPPPIEDDEAEDLDSLEVDKSSRDSNGGGVEGEPSKLSKDISMFLGKLFGVKPQIIDEMEDDEKEMEEDKTRSSQQQKLFNKRKISSSSTAAAEAVAGKLMMGKSEPIEKSKMIKSKGKKSGSKKKAQEESDELNFREFAKETPDITLDSEELLRRTKNGQKSKSSSATSNTKRRTKPSQDSSLRDGIGIGPPGPLPNFAFDGHAGGHHHHPAHNYDPDLDPEVEKIRLDIFRQKKRLKKWKKILKWEVVELKSELITKLIDFMEFITPA